MTLALADAPELLDPARREAQRRSLRTWGWRCDRCLAALRDGTASWGGALHAVVARTGVTDAHGDLVVRGALRRPCRVIVSYDRHEALANPRLQVGHAWVAAYDDAVVALVLFDASRDGRQAAEQVLQAHGDWSVGVTLTEWRAADAVERARGLRRVVFRWRIHEISPLLSDPGAGRETGSLSYCLGVCDATGRAQRAARVEALMLRQRSLEEEA